MTTSYPTPNTEHVLSGIAIVQATQAGKLEIPFRFYIDTATSIVGNMEVRAFHSY